MGKRLSILQRLWFFRPALGLSLLCLAVIVSLGGLGCVRRTAEPVAPGSYKGTPEELQRLWTDILTACQTEDRERLRVLMASFTMTEPELASLLGPAQARALWPRYKALLGSLGKAGAIELLAHVYEKKYDDIAVNRIDTLPDAEQAETDRSVLFALRAVSASPPPLYTVRVKRKKETRGLRYDFFVYLNGYWRSGNLLGKYLPAAPPLQEAASAPASAQPSAQD